jgi:hypothetical protein
MRKSFTRLFSVLVLLLLSIQMVIATPTLKTSGGLSPSDGGTVASAPNPVFTMNFQAAVAPVAGQIIGLYNSSGLVKSIQLRPVDADTINGAIVFSHTDGTVTFNGSVVTIQFASGALNQATSYWITVGGSAIKDPADGNYFNPATGFVNSKWEFTTKDTTAPTVKALWPADNSKDVSNATNFGIKFNEKVKLSNCNIVQNVGDFALYYSLDSNAIVFQEGGDLLSVTVPTIRFYDGASLVGTTSASVYPAAACSTPFDSVAIVWAQTLPDNAIMYVRVKPSLLVDGSGNAFAGINDNEKWNFNTKDGSFKAFEGGFSGSSFCPASNFFINLDPTNVETLYLASNNKALYVNQDLSSIVKVADKDGNPILGSVKFISLTKDSIVIDPTNALTSAMSPFTISIDAGKIKDASGNLNAAFSKTLYAGNWDAPKLVSTRVTNQSGTSFDFMVKANEAATVNYIVVRKGASLAPTLDQIFGETPDTVKTTNGVESIVSGITGFPAIRDITTANVHNDYYILFDSTSTGYSPLVPDSLFEYDGAYQKFYGKQTGEKTFSIVEIFAQGSINVPAGNFEVLERIAGLPATHGMQDTPPSEYDVYFVLADNSGASCNIATTYYGTRSELLSGILVDTTAYTTNILMPEAWFDADSTKAGKLINAKKFDPVQVGTANALGTVRKDGKIYINFNEAIRDNDGTELTDAEIKDALFVYEGATMPAGADRNSDTNWSSNVSFTTTYDVAKKQIVITRSGSWSSGTHIWVKIKNSLIEDVAGNEIVPYGNLYTQEFVADSYIAPIVRYTFGKNPLDSLQKVNYVNYKDGTPTIATIDVAVSSKIFVFPGTVVNGNVYQNSTQANLIPFTSNPADDQYIGKFFKIRKAPEKTNTVSASMGDALELTDFEYKIDYTYGDSTKITITPKKQYDSEVWYYIELDPRIQDVNFRTIAQGAAVADSIKPAGFKWNKAYTGNATLVPSWSKSFVPTPVGGVYTIGDNSSVVFKTEDSRNPVLTFFSKQLETTSNNVLDALPIDNIQGKSNIALNDTIGVFIDEYVALGFDHYVHFDSLANYGNGGYVLDANAMRRYFKVFDGDSVEMNFDIVDLDTTRLANDTLIFYIDPYYVNANGQAISKTETANFGKNTKYTAYFNSADADDQGKHEVFGKLKGIYWDDNNNLVIETRAQFTTAADPNPGCVSVAVTPVPGTKNLNPANVQFIDLAFNSSVLFGSSVPSITLQEGTSTAVTIAGQVFGTYSDHVRFPVALNSSSSYTVRIGSAVNGQVTLTGNASANEWPAEDCNPNVVADSVWTYTTIDATAPELDTTSVWMANAKYDAVKYGVNFLSPTDDDTLFNASKDLVLVFDEEVYPVTGKRLTIYDSNDLTVAVIYAQALKYGVTTDKKEDKHVLIVPNAYFGPALKYTTNYHVSIDNGFVTDLTGNKWAGIWVEDDFANGAALTDLANDWSFRTAADPAPYFAKFSPMDIYGGVTDLSITFSEPVNANPASGTSISVYTMAASGPHTPFTFAPTNTTYITPSADRTVWTISATALGLTYGSQYFVTINENSFIGSSNVDLEVPCAQGTVAYDLNNGTAQTSTGPAAQWWVRFGDNVAPSVLKTWPRNNYDQIPYNAYIYVKFTEPVQFGNGSAIIPDPNPNTKIDSFVQINVGSRVLAASEYDVEFVGNDKTMLRITPKDHLGYQYNATNVNPTMVPDTAYSVTILPITAGGTRLVDAVGNFMVGSASSSFTFYTEDIAAPAISNASLALDSVKCTNKVTFQFDVTEETLDTAVVYYAVLPKVQWDSNKPSASDLFAQTVPNATVQGIKGADSTGVDGITFTVELPEGAETPEYVLWAVVQDVERDIWVPASSAWDSLFMFAGNYGEGYDRIQDIMPSPNKNYSVYGGASTTFKLWDNDAPTILGSYPLSGTFQFPVEDSVRFWFSEAVNQGNVAGLPDSIYLRRYDNNIAVAARVEWPSTGVDADSTFVIFPDSLLEQETRYYVEFDRYAIQDSSNICPNNSVYYPQMVGRGFWFETEDNIAPRLKDHSPDTLETCVACPDLNQDGTDKITVFFNDANELKINPKATATNVSLFRIVGTDTLAWDVIPASSITFAQADNDTTWQAIIPLVHEYYSNDVILVSIPANLFSDKYGNAYATKIEWKYTTCNTGAPAVTATILDLEGYFNYSTATEQGIYGKWDTYKTYPTGSVAKDVPTHIALKVDFGEDVFFNTSATATPKWEKLSTYGTGSSALTASEIMKVLNVSGLTYSETTPATKSNIDSVVVIGNTVTLLFKSATSATVLPVYELLAAAQSASNISGNGISFLEDYYKASLKSDTEYKVTLAANKVLGDTLTTCSVATQTPRYATPNVLTFTTRNDDAATVSYYNDEAKAICGTTACVAPKESITITFSKPIVKSSFDISWNGIDNESSTYDNLPLSVLDLQATSGGYLEFNRVTYNTTTKVYDVVPNSSVSVVATTANDYRNFTITPKNDLVSEGTYRLVFNKFTVKNFIENDPNGTVFEGDTCYFTVSDYVAPVVDVTVDANNFVDGLNPSYGTKNQDSNTKKVQIVFNEQVLLGTGVTKIRRAEAEQGASVFAEFDVNSPNVTLLNNVKTDGDTLVFNLPNGLEEFTKYYVEMPKGYITDNDSCYKNPFKGFSAKLGVDGEMLSADYWFQTTDATAPELISVVVDQDTILDVEGSVVGLFPIPGATVAKDSKLRLTFDENIKLSKTLANQGIVIYHSNGDAGSFGNAVEFIPWSDIANFYNNNGSYRLSLSGTDIYNGLNTNVIEVDPLTTFEAKGTYYVRVNGDSVFDFASTPNSWASSIREDLNAVKDHEWWFGVANDVAPVLVETNPTYDGVNKPQVYVTLGEGEADYGFVKADLSMTFYDNTKANGGQPLNVAKGDSLRKVRIFEYTYDAVSKGFKANPIVVLPITDPSITIDGNVVTINDVILKDGINGKGASVEADSAYYVTVDAGAILNGFSQSQTFWPGISNGFRWRFQTADDTVFVAGYDIVSPNIEDDDSLAMDLTIEAAKDLIVEFEEAIAADANPTGKVQLFDEVGLVHEFTVTAAMCNGKKLTVPAGAYIKDETSYHVMVQAGAFNDGSNAGNPNFGFGGVGVWEFTTGDNTNPAPVIIPDSCIASNVTFTLTYNESKGITKGSGSIKVTNDSVLVDEFDVNDIEFVADSTGLKTVGTISLEGLKDTTTYTLTIPAGFVYDGDETPLASNEIVWNFTTADNTLPTAKVVTPVLAVTADTTVTIKFSEIVTPVVGKFVTIGGTKYATSAFSTVDNITYTVAVTKLPSEVDCPVTFEKGAFVDVNAGCTPNGIADGFTTTFKVADISSPVAIGSPSVANDYVGLEIALNFDDAVTKGTGNVKIYDAENDSLIETIAVSKFTAASDSVYTYETENVRFGEYYVLMDAGSFVDNGAIEGFRQSVAIEKGDWSLVVSDTEFDCAGEIVYPTRGLTNVPLDTTIVISFCGERILVGTKPERFVTIADQSVEEDYIYYSVVDSMIDGDKLSIAVSGLKENTTYSIIIAPGAITDEAGNEFVGIIDANTWFFTTGDFSVPVVTVTPDTVYNNAAGKVTITSTEAGFVYFAQEDVPATQQALLAAVQNDLAVAATIAANGSAELSTKGLKVGNYKAYAIDATGSIGVAKNIVVVIDDILPLTTISTIQGTASASLLDGQMVRTQGTVTAIDKNGFYMQDANAAWSGVYVYSTQYAGEVSIGNSVQLVATVDEYNGLTELTGVESLEFISKVITPAAIEIPATEALSEKYESVLVTVIGRATDAYSGTADWSVNTGSQTIAISNYIYGTYSSLKDYKYQVTGVVYTKNDTYKVEPRIDKDIINLSQRDGIDDLASQVKVYPNPFDKFISLSVSSDVVITKAVITNIAGQLVKEVINPSNSISTTELRSGVYFISLHTVDGIAKTERIIKR